MFCIPRNSPEKITIWNSSYSTFNFFKVISYHNHESHRLYSFYKLLQLQCSKIYLSNLVLCNQIFHYQLCIYRNSMRCKNNYQLNLEIRQKKHQLDLNFWEHLCKRPPLCHYNTGGYLASDCPLGFVDH